MSAQHTPGSWRLVPVRSESVWMIHAGEAETVAEVYGDTPANARLIAAAPEMKMLLEGAAIALEAAADTLAQLDQYATAQHFYGRAERIRDAIAKAEGR